MVPITPAGRYDTSPRGSNSSRQRPDTADDLASRSRPLATHSNLRADEVAAVRRSLVVAFAAMCLIATAGTAATVFSPAVRTLLALSGP